MARLTILLLLAFSSRLCAQTFVFMDPDPVPNCSMLKSGVFRSGENPFEDYRMEVQGDTITEYVAHGEYFVKTKVRYLNTCAYQSTIIAVTIPDYNLKVGTKMQIQILETQCEFVKIKGIIDGKETIAVLEKIE